MAETGSGEKLKVFISYSRRDSSEFADELVNGLELAGFAPFLDRHDIAPGEKWEERLGGLIAEADTVVFIVSPEAVKSERCAWEVEQTLRQSKRLLPVVFKPVAEADIPEKLREWQFVRFDTATGITRPLRELADALRYDIDWIREHTRIGEMAARWEARGRPASLLLRVDVVAAEAWMKNRKPDAPAISDAMQAFIAASKEADAAAEQRMARYRLQLRHAQAFRRLAAVVAAIFVAVLILGSVAWWQEIWLKKQVYALVNVRSLKITQERALKLTDSFKECTDCPEMIVIPAGSFVMGSSATEREREADEGPQHKVTIAKSFAVGKFDVTLDQWEACVAHGDCLPHNSDSGWERGQRPVINVSWDDAQMYVAWISSVTGEPYQLLTEAEWEYAARAGTTTAYYWGDDVGKGNANCDGCGSQWDNLQTSPAGSFKPNAFGLYDMAGNVLEWTQDCYHDGYGGAPSDGSTWTSGDCSRRVVRGGSWYVRPQYLRSAYRKSDFPTFQDYDLGFRVGRTLLTPLVLCFFNLLSPERTPVCHTSSSPALRGECSR